ncbi:MAG: PIN domain-containing protein [Spirochaetes bacterium]|nr:PIN domain-containing protein [Spirochaetota bacterium]
MNKKVYVDTDIVLDLLTERKPFYNSAAKIFSLAVENKIQLFVSPVLISNVFYILRKSSGQESAVINLRKLRTMINIVPVNQKIIDHVLASNFKDLEDGIQYYSAIEAGIKIILTRNSKDFTGKPVSIMNCEEYLAV